MEKVSIKKKFVIEYDVIDGEITFFNEDELSFIEILGAIEYVKMMVMNEWIQSED